MKSSLIWLVNDCLIRLFISLESKYDQQFPAQISFPIDCFFLVSSEKKSTWFVVVDVKCVYGGDFPIFVSLKWKRNDKINLYDSSLTSQRLTQCLYFFFNTCWYQMCCGAKLIWQQRAFKSSVVGFFQNQNTAKNNFVLVINNGCVEGWDLFGKRIPPPKLHPLQSSDCLCLWCVAEQKQGFMFSLLLKFSIKQKQNQFVLDTWICWRVRFASAVFCFVFCILFRILYFVSYFVSYVDAGRVDLFGKRLPPSKLHPLQSSADWPSGKWMIGQWRWWGWWWRWWWPWWWWWPWGSWCSW